MLRQRLFSVLILCLMVAHLAGFYVYFVVRLGEVRMEMRKKLADLPASELEVISVPRESFRSAWLDELEMKWRGNMYDIARVEPQGKYMIVYCLHDEDEDNLLSFLASVVETAQQDNNQAPDSVVQFITLEFVASSVLLPQINEQTLAKAATGFTMSTTSFLDGPGSPPPRI